jgi:CDP-glucose 4,6-dehydratase
VAIGPGALETVVSAVADMVRQTGVDAGFWRGKRVLLTGHTGFKGGWLALWLSRLGAQVTGLALPPTTQPSLFEAAGIAELCIHHLCDMRDAAAVAARVQQAAPQIVLHLAAQPLVRASYRDPLATYATNVMGTAHVLDALRRCVDVRAVVVVTTDKVYRNHEWAYPYREGDALGGHDPYSASKAAAEIVAASYRDAFLNAQGVALATARAGNVIGGGDWSEDRLIPDAVRAWQSGAVLAIRRPQAIRPWQHVIEPLAAYLQLAQALWHQPALAGAYNFGPATADAATVGDVVALARAAFGRGDWVRTDPGEGPHEAGWLALEVAQARVALGVTPRWTLAEAVARTMHWYRAVAEGADALAQCLSDIDAYTGEAALAAQPAEQRRAA